MENTEGNIVNGENPPPYYLVVKPSDPPPSYANIDELWETPPVVPYYINEPLPPVFPPHVAQRIIITTEQYHPDQRRSSLVVIRHKKARCYGGSGVSAFIIILIGIALWLGVRYGITMMSRRNMDTCPSNTVICDGHVDCKQGSDETICVRFGAGNELQVMTSNSNGFLPICYDDWNQSLATQTCKQLGFRGCYQYGSLTSTSTSFLFVSQSSDTIQGKVNVSTSCPDKETVSLQCTNCGLSQSSSRIIGGDEADPGQWPWQVSLHFQGSHVCGGSVISQDFIVSAAHCFPSDPPAWQVPANWRVYLGVESQYMLPAPQYIADIIIHELYNPNTHDNDIALLKLTQPINFTGMVQPVCLPAYDQVVLADTECWTTGFGTTEEGEDHGSIQLMEVEVEIIDRSLCNTAYKGLISNDMLCAGDMNGGKDACQGDSGGPLVCQDDDGHWYLYGVTSWGIGCGRVNRPGVYTDVHSYVAWIHSKIEEYRP
ncbi:transmembrane protease serine 13b [Clarias gariepinus]|uniref:transmembrane protease serine 13b n=1 Tax=Clarias gariepinus TaxID=13013 RepID=UPI00234E05CF|nr:transmembrane protease serine 13b [Clarias gariepinus]